MANVKISALDAATALAGTETLAVVQTSTKKATVNQLSAAAATYTEAALAAAAAVGSVIAGYDFLMFDGTTKKRADVDLLAAYIVASGWAAASEADPAVAGDMVLANRSGTIYELDVDTIAAYALDTGASNTPVVSVAAGDDFFIYRSGDRKLIDVSYVASYVIATAWASDAVTSLLSTDTVFVGRSAVSKQVTIADLETQIVTDKKTTILDISGLSAATLGATDTFLINQGGVSLKVALSALETKLHADFATYAAGLADAATLDAADKFYILNSGTPKYATSAEIAAFATASILASAAVSPCLTGDLLLLNRSDVAKTATIDDLATYVNASAQATVLNLAGLDTATIVGTDLMLVCQTTTGKKATASSVAAYVHAGLNAYTAALTEISTPTDSDLLYCLQGGTEKKLTVGALVEYATAAALTLPWVLVSGTKYTATPASTSELTMSDTSDFAIGLPVKYTYNSFTYYGIVTSVAANASITIAGAPLNISYPLTALSVGIPEMVRQVDFTVNSIFDDAVQDILAEVEERYFKWQGATAYLVAFSVVQHWPDSGATQPYVNVKIKGNLISTNSSSQGVQGSAVAGTWVDSSAVAINTTVGAGYAIERGDSVELRCTVEGTNGDAECLTVSCVFIYE
jgi:hypothetical protein